MPVRRSKSDAKALQEGHILKVLQVTPELNAGGVEKTTLEIAQAISRAGGLALVASAGGRLEPYLEAAGGELIKLPVHSKNPFTIAANVQRLEALIQARGVNIVHARSRAPGWSAYLAARAAKVGFVTTFHGIYKARSPLKRLYNSVMARGDLVIANSEYTRQHVLDDYDVAPERVITIPRGVDLNAFDPERVSDEAVRTMRAGWGVPAGDRRQVILAAARVTRWKGQAELIEAAKLLQQRRPDRFKVVLAGDPQGRATFVDELKRAIAAAGLAQVVSLVGHVYDMPTAFAACDVAVFPVIEPEAFGRGAIEAQAMGKPIVASRLGGFIETVVEGESGFLVDAGAPAPLADALERVLAMSAEQRAEMGARGRARVASLYSTAALQEATLAVYHRVLLRN
jgi:glycosyltransferase involved in cell wall biosynthesis